MAMENVTASLVLDVINHDLSSATVKAIALDSKTRYVRATITQDGFDYSVDENATVTLTILRPDNVGVQITGSVVDVDNSDRTGTIKGVFAELTQAALAKSGTLDAQFKMTVGQQILRTEIFSIKNGIALDGETSEWADQYEGYNLDELVQSVNTAVATVGEMGSDVNDLKEDLSEALYNRSYVPEWINGSYIGRDDGIEHAHNSWCHTDYLEVKAKKLHFNLANDRSVVYNNFYDANKTWIGWFTIKGETLVDVPARAVYLRISQVIKELPDFTWYVWDKTDDVIVKAVDDYVIPLNRYVDGYVGTDGNIVTAKNWIYSDYIKFDGGLLIATNTSSDGTTHYTLKKKKKNFLGNFSVYPNTEDAEIIAPNGTKYFRYSHMYTVYDLVSFSLASKKTYYSHDILALNSKETVGQLIMQSRKMAYPYDGDFTAPDPVTFSVFTDIHAFKTEFARYLRFNNAYANYISDALCLGDMVRDNFSQDFTWWSQNKDAKNILITLGNHDACSRPENVYVLQSAADCYNKYYAPLISNWAVTHYTNGLCYYYKDYQTGSGNTVRLIILDALHYTQDQHDWFVNLLSDSLNNSMAVVCAMHYIPLGNKTKIEGNFYNDDRGFTGIDYGANISGIENHNARLEQATIAIDNFKEAGGEFVAWMCGHQHYDTFGEVTVNGRKQVFLSFENAGCHNAHGDGGRVEGTKSEDSFNFVTIDVHSKLVKVVRIGNNMSRFFKQRNYICYDYGNNVVVSYG